jgi:hypothetical protein
MVYLCNVYNDRDEAQNEALKTLVYIGILQVIRAGEAVFV